MKFKHLFVLALLALMPYKIYAVSEITTADTKSLGVTINLFDYDGIDNINSPYATYSKQQINSLSPLKFTPGKGGELAEPSNTSDVGTAVQGIVLPTLGSDGFPVMYNNESLNVLFNTQPNGYKRVYSNANHLFKKSSNATFIYDSDTNYAYYNPAQGNNGNFKVYDSTYKVSYYTNGYDKTQNAGFFPFDAYDPSKDIVAQTENLTGGKAGYNHYFGLTMTSNLVYPQDGKLNGKDLIFRFSGDDDVWVFIDDVLVLDIGGIHAQVNGTINLTTGAITINKAARRANSTATVMGTSNKIDSLFSAQNKTFNRTYKSKHTIKFFYLERGSVASNMMIETNFWDIAGDGGSWRVRFYKDNVLQDTQNCDYDNSKKCAPGDIHNPTGDVYRLDSCNGQIVQNVNTYVVTRNTDLYVCTEPVVNPQTGNTVAIILIGGLLLATAITAFILQKHIKL